MRYLVSFNNNEKEQELQAWILKKASIVGFSNFMKQIAYEVMQKEKGEK